LYATYPANTAEEKRAESCSMNDSPDKMAEITEEMKAVVQDYRKLKN
jgi:hypothetical protein